MRRRILKKTLVVKRKPVIGRGFGKRYGKIVGQGFKANPPSVVKADIQQQIEQLIQIPEDSWRWWQLSNDLIIEKSPKDADFISSPTFYYLPQRRWVMAQNPGLYFGEELGWYVDIADITYEPTYGCWIVTDLFCDVIILKDNRTHSVLDLDELAEVFEGGLVTQNQLVQILRDTQALIDLIRSGNFPPAEIEECQRLYERGKQVPPL